MSDACTVTFDGTGSGTYIIPCNMIEYMGDDLVNHYSGSYYGLSHISNNGREYPYIQFGANSYPVLYSNYNTSVVITDASNVKFNARGYFYADRDYIFLLMAFCVCLRCIKGIFN